MISARALEIRDEKSFRSACNELKREGSGIPFAFHFEEKTDFKDYVRRVNSWPQGESLPEGFVPNTYWVGVVDDKIVGRISIRHELNAFLKRVGGHLGYAVVPSERGKGYAKYLLEVGLRVAAQVGIKKALLTCDDDNPASIRVIESCGGVFEGLVENEKQKPKRRYWIETGHFVGVHSM